MSAKVEVRLVKTEAITLPIAAVFKKGEAANYVRIRDPKTKAIKEVQVKTGNTTQTDVEILSGLKPGDEVVIGH
jgi:macrolide-specific efflux system membrane fusion protein